jgi:hypothetical protein
LTKGEYLKCAIVNFQSHNIINYLTTSRKHPNNNQPLGGELATGKLDEQTVYDSRRSDARLLVQFAGCSQYGKSHHALDISRFGTNNVLLLTMFLY